MCASRQITIFLEIFVGIYIICMYIHTIDGNCLLNCNVNQNIQIFNLKSNEK